MERENVHSSMIESIGYTAENLTMEIEFKNEQIWQYYDVPESVYNEMKSSGKFGTFFNENIRGIYAERQIY
jgi:hypothetical protein